MPSTKKYRKRKQTMRLKKQNGIKLGGGGEGDISQSEINYITNFIKDKIAMERKMSNERYNILKNLLLENKQIKSEDSYKSVRNAIADIEEYKTDVELEDEAEDKAKDEAEGKVNKIKEAIKGQITVETTSEEYKTLMTPLYDELYKQPTKLSYSKFVSKAITEVKKYREEIEQEKRIEQEKKIEPEKKIEEEKKFNDDIEEYKQKAKEIIQNAASLWANKKSSKTTDDEFRKSLQELIIRYDYLSKLKQTYSYETEIPNSAKYLSHLDDILSRRGGRKRKNTHRRRTRRRKH
jgi:hypothetical protein